MAAQDRTRADAHLGTDQTKRTDHDVFGKFCLRIDDCALG